MSINNCNFAKLGLSVVHDVNWVARVECKIEEGLFKQCMLFRMWIVGLVRRFWPEQNHTGHMHITLLEIPTHLSPKRPTGLPPRSRPFLIVKASRSTNSELCSLPFRLKLEKVRLVVSFLKLIFSKRTGWISSIKFSQEKRKFKIFVRWFSQTHRV